MSHLTPKRKRSGIVSALVALQTFIMTLGFVLGAPTAVQAATQLQVATFSAAQAAPDSTTVNFSIKGVTDGSGNASAYSVLVTGGGSTLYDNGVFTTDTVDHFTVPTGTASVTFTLNYEGHLTPPPGNWTKVVSLSWAPVVQNVTLQAPGGITKVLNGPDTIATASAKASDGTVVGTTGLCAGATWQQDAQEGHYINVCLLDLNTGFNPIEGNGWTSDGHQLVYKVYDQGGYTAPVQPPLVMADWKLGDPTFTKNTDGTYTVHPAYTNPTAWTFQAVEYVDGTSIGTVDIAPGPAKAWAKSVKACSVVNMVISGTDDFLFQDVKAPCPTTTSPAPEPSKTETTQAPRPEPSKTTATWSPKPIVTTTTKAAKPSPTVSIKPVPAHTSADGGSDPLDMGWLFAALGAVGTGAGAVVVRFKARRR